jgi:hypothetical protein
MDVFLGDFGAMMNDINAYQKIQRNMQTLRICQSLALEHVNRLKNFQAQVAGDVAATDNMLRQLDAELRAQRRREFEALRNACGNQRSMQQTIDQYLSHAPPIYEEATAPPLYKCY